MREAAVAVACLQMTIPTMIGEFEMLSYPLPSYEHLNYTSITFPMELLPATLPQPSASWKESHDVPRVPLHRQSLNSGKVELSPGH
jgi:hypothetical protein